ncbi:Alpha-N-acetylgalactosaminidase [subsurface metagenome]
MTVNRRDFIRQNAVTGLGLAITPGLMGAARAVGAGPSRKVMKKARLGFIGMGSRGTSLMNLALEREDTEIIAVCDIKEEATSRSVKMIEDTGKNAPAVYNSGELDYIDLLSREDIDGVIIATPWIWHTPMALAAMKAGKYAGVEVPAGLTLEDCYELVRVSEETGMPCMMLENVCYRRDVMAILNMVRKGMFGELVHCQCGYQHDLRGVKFSPGVEFGEGAEGEAEWRTLHSVRRNGDLYPTHGIGPVAHYLDINRGNRFISLTSMASESSGLHEYIVKTAGEDHPHSKIEFKLGDIVTTLIKCANGETVMISHDTNLPRPYSLGFRVQGTKGLWMKDGDQIYMEGTSESHKWESSLPYIEKYDHPLWKKYEDQAAGSGHGGMDFFVIHAFIESLKRGVATPLDVYDAASWSVIIALSERSVANGGAPQDFPDFTGGRWMKRKPSFGFGDEY